MKLPACAPARDLRVNEARGRGAGERRRRQRALRAQEEKGGIFEGDEVGSKSAQQIRSAKHCASVQGILKARATCEFTLWGKAECEFTFWEKAECEFTFWEKAECEFTFWKKRRM